MDDIVQTICRGFPSPESRAKICARCTSLFSTADKLEQLTKDTVPTTCSVAELTLGCPLCDMLKSASLSQCPPDELNAIHNWDLKVFLSTDLEETDEDEYITSDIGAPQALFIQCGPMEHRVLIDLHLSNLPQTSFGCLGLDPGQTLQFDNLQSCDGLYDSVDWWASAEFTQPILPLVEQCRRTHSNCGPKTSPILPSLVLDVSRLATTQKVFLTAKNKLELQGEYIALSYCWGGPQALVTTVANLSAHITDGIDFGRLPQAISEAVALTSLLGVRYIWIDALCIVQDDDDLKIKEIENMASIYANATLVIIAAGTLHTVNDSFLDTMSSLAVVPFYNKAAGTTSPVCLSRTDVEYLDTRAWTFQERHLASRTLEFRDAQGTIFSCRESCHQFTSAVTPNADVAGWSQGRPQHDNTPLLNNWHQVVQEYSLRALTYPGDRLPALASFAKHFHHTARTGHDTYLAGIWESSLVDDLMWFSPPEMNPQLSLSEYSSPGWSWISVNDYKEGNRSPRTAILFRRPDLLGARDESMATFVRHGVGLAHSAATYGSVLSGSSIIMEGVLLPLRELGDRHRDTFLQSNGRSSTLLDDGVTTAEYSCQYALSEDDKDQVRLFLLKQTVQWDVPAQVKSPGRFVWGHGGLLMLPHDDTQAGRDVFRRIGTFWHWTPGVYDETQEDGWWDHAERREIVIV